MGAVMQVTSFREGGPSTDFSLGLERAARMVFSPYIAL
jgi:hypothetical protein